MQERFVFDLKYIFILSASNASVYFQVLAMTFSLNVFNCKFNKFVSSASVHKNMYFMPVLKTANVVVW